MAITGSSRQTRALRSSDAVATCKPSALNARRKSTSRGPRASQRPAARRVPYPRRIVRGAVTMLGPSGLIAALNTQSVWPDGFASAAPVAPSHTIAVLSSAALTMPCRPAERRRNTHRLAGKMRKPARLGVP